MVVYPGGERFKALDYQLHNKGLLCSAEGSQYVFVDTENRWCNLASPSAIARVCSLMDIKNATVNYDTAFLPYMEHLLKRCDSNISSPIPTSVCIGTARLEIDSTTEKGTMLFRESRTVLEEKHGKVPQRVYGLCYMPVAMHIMPDEYTFPGKCSLLAYIAQLYPDPRDLVTLMWHVGNCLLDPSENPKSLMLCGPGGSGKSTALRTIYTALRGCCGTLPDGSLTTNFKRMPAEVAGVIVSSRMAVCYDVDLEKDMLNMAVFKNISGSDYIRVGNATCKSNCSLIIGTNGMVDLDAQPTYISDAIMRRLVCLYMDVSAISIPKTKIPDGADDKLDFVCACLHTRLQYDHIPVSPRNVVLTLCALMYGDVMELIEETTDAMTVLEYTEVLDVISYVTKVSRESVAYKAKLISASAVLQVDGKTYIKGLRPVR